jgi:hypothetical protein
VLESDVASNRARRIWRVIRRSPAQAVSDWLGILFSESQFVSFCLSVLTSWIGLQTATIPELIDAAGSWLNAVQAFVYVAVAWLGICVLRAPFRLIASDRTRGRWVSDRRFEYFEPLRACDYRFQATGEPSHYVFKWPHAEPGSFVYCSLKFDPDVRHRAKARVGGTVFLGNLMAMTNWDGRIGIKLPRDNRAVLSVELLPGTVSTTVKVYCHSFSIDNPEDLDGSLGNAATPFVKRRWWHLLLPPIPRR